MGDRWMLKLKCSYCGVLNKNLYYAPSCGLDKFFCRACKKENLIVEDFKAIGIKRK